MDTKLAKIYYSPQGYWKGVSAIKKLADTAKVSVNVVKQWLYKQAIWQIYLPAPQYVPRPKFDMATPNSVHQPDLLFLPHDKLRRKTYKYALTVVDIASRYKEAEPLTSKDSNEVARAFQAIYRHGPLIWPQCCRLILDASSWAASRKKWTNTRLSFDVAALRFTEIKQLLSVSIARLLSGCLAISMPLRCFMQDGRLCG